MDLLRSYLQRLRFSLEPGSSAVVVDWLGAGRVAKGECWAFKEYRSQLEFMWSEEHHLAHPEEPGRVRGLSSSVLTGIDSWGKTQVL